MTPQTTPHHAHARNALIEAGYSEFIELSESGDAGYGSREYWKRPGATLNEYGYPFERASISWVGSVWHINLPEYGPTSLDLWVAERLAAKAAA